MSVVYLAPVRNEAHVAGADDAGDARWFSTDALPELAFDHAVIVTDAIVSSSGNEGRIRHSR